MSTTSGEEREIKIPVADLAALRRRLEAAGARLEQTAVREQNTVYDTSDLRLRAAGLLLRLRRVDRQWLLTYKGPATFAGGVKRREELEVEPGDGQVMELLLGRLGFRPVARYEKDRETWRHEGVAVTLDHTPMGDFVELEGGGDLEALAAAVGLDPGRAVRGSYLELWEQYRRDHPALGLPADMVLAPAEP